VEALTVAAGPENTPAITPGSPVRDLWPPDRGGYAGRMGTVAMACLRRARVGTVGELTGKTAQDIDDIRQAGPAVVGEIRRVLAVHGLDLKAGGGLAPAVAAARARVLMRAGLKLGPARRFARESWPSGQIAPGVTLTVAEADRG
jgi:hypothetical protein